MMNYYEYPDYDSVVHSFRCYVEISGHPSETAEVELEIVVKKQKYGLLQVIYLPSDGKVCHSKEDVIPCIYDHLSYQMIVGGSCLIAVQKEKCGILSIQAITTPSGYVLSIKEIVPCKYDRIEYQVDCPAMFHLFHSGKESYYDLICKKTSATYDTIQILYPNILECWNGNIQTVVNLNNSTESYS